MYQSFLFQNDMCTLKTDNDRLNRMVHSSQSLNSSHSSLPHHNRTSSESLERTISLTENTSLGMNTIEPHSLVYSLVNINLF